MCSGEKEVDADKSLKMSNNHWNCCVAGCLSNHRHEKDDPSLHYFRIPKRHRSAYQAFCKTDDVNWDRARICSISIGVSQVSEGENVDSMCFRI